MAKSLRPILIFASALALGVPAPVSAGGKLSKHDEQLLSAAQARGEKQVTVLIAVSPGNAPAVADAVARLGGGVRFQDDDFGYLRAQVPVEKVAVVAKLAYVETANLDRMIPKPDPRPQGTGEGLLVDPPSEATPLLNPYLPTRDTGAAQFVAANPKFDGRGVTIGILDTGVTLDHPSLQTTTTGERKVIDWITATDPIDDNDPTWINMQDEVNGKVFTYKGVTYKAPGKGRFRIGLFDERDPRLSGPDSEYSVPTAPTGALLGDVNRDGNPAGSSGVFAVLWDTDRKLVWVDANQNHDFSDDPAMTDYKIKHDIGTFGTDDPTTPVTEAVKFVVQTDHKHKYVNIGIVAGAHGSHVAGIAAGKNLFGGDVNGAAPGAQIVSCRACLFTEGCTEHALIEGMIYAVKNSNVDVVNMSIGGLPPLNDGNNALALLYNRLVEKFKCQMFLSAGNDGSGINTAGDPGVATKVVSCGAYFHKDTLLFDYGNEATKDDNIFPFSSRGPREDGGMKPSLLAPGAAVSTIPMWQEGQPVAGTYFLPAGYAMFNGTSMAAPQSAGAAALLVSAAKQRHAQWKPAQLRQALYSSARYLPGFAAHEQGTGLLQVGPAWELLQQDIKTVDIESAAPVNTIISQFLPVPNQGPGLYEREGWAAGQSGTRNIALLRNSGGNPRAVYNLSWIGNDGTFGSDNSIRLPEHSPVVLPVTVQPLTAGAHSAILNVDDPATPGVDYQILNTIVAADDMNEANGFAATRSGNADRHDKAAFYFRVPTGSAAFKVDVTGISGRVRFLRFHPYGVGIDSESTPFQTGGSQTRTLANPTPGVWEVTVETSRASAITPASFNVTGSLLGVQVTPALVTIDPTIIGTTYNQDFTFENTFGAFTGNAVGGPLGSASKSRLNIANFAQQLQAIDVPAGSASLRVKIGNPSDLGADLDLYLFLETDGVPGLSADDALIGYSADGDAEEEVVLSGPPTGTYYALIDGFFVPSGTTDYDYLDVFVNPALGSASITDAPAAHANGDVWTRTASVTANAAPAAGRLLQGFVEVKSGSAVIGTSEIN